MTPNINIDTDPDIYDKNYEFIKLSIKEVKKINSDLHLENQKLKYKLSDVRQMILSLKEQSNKHFDAILSELSDYTDL